MAKFSKSYEVSFVCCLLHVVLPVVLFFPSDGLNLASRLFMVSYGYFHRRHHHHHHHHLTACPLPHTQETPAKVMPLLGCASHLETSC